MRCWACRGSAKSSVDGWLRSGGVRWGRTRRWRGKAERVEKGRHHLRRRLGVGEPRSALSVLRDDGWSRPNYPPACAREKRSRATLLSNPHPAPHTRPEMSDVIDMHELRAVQPDTDACEQHPVGRRR
ncbi:hypothetical protein BHE74_00053675 [Ensete ventricosum]|nr:hypothetical protein BHE74_00053675 [Ensete ventricosum]